MSERGKPTVHQRWAHLRFSVVGHLLASPPKRGELRGLLKALAAREWLHPTTAEPTRFGLPTIERWYYLARKARTDPVGALLRKVRTDSGQITLSEKLRAALLAQYAAHKSWSYQLHRDNLAALVAADATLLPLPSYSTIRRCMKALGLLKRRRLCARDTAGAQQAEARLELREVRSFEAEYVNGLWHLDFHHGSRKVLTARGEWMTPLLLGVLDDRSRLCAHLQWYLAETAENLVHGLSQAIQKRGLPRALLTDNGSPMVAAETREGLSRLSIIHETTLPHSPYQNAKQEVFWAQVEGRLLAMLEGCEELTLAALNEATQAWVEMEYHREPHREIGTTPLQRFLAGPDVGRPSPDSAALRLAFAKEEDRTQRKSDGTVSIEGRRFEVPSRYRHLERVRVRYASWDLSHLHLIDERTGNILSRLYPLDRTRNADGKRRTLEPPALTAQVAPPAPGVAPLLKKLLADYAATGLPPAYLPKDDKGEKQ